MNWETKEILNTLERINERLDVIIYLMEKNTPAQQNVLNENKQPTKLQIPKLTNKDDDAGTYIVNDESQV